MTVDTRGSGHAPVAQRLMIVNLETGREVIDRDQEADQRHQRVMARVRTRNADHDPDLRVMIKVYSLYLSAVVLSSQSCNFI